MKRSSMLGEAADSPVFQRAELLRARATQPVSPWSLAVGVGGAALIGLVVFASMSSERRARVQAPSQPAPAAAVVAPVETPVVMAQTPPPPPPPVYISPPPAAAPPPPVADLVTPHWRAPAMVVDLTDPAAPAEASRALIPVAAGAPAPAAADDTHLSAEERFSARVDASQVETAHATRLRDPSRTAPQGTMIPAVLETALNSDLPGSVRAVVSRDVRGFDGTQVLIPRGSKLIGQYRSGVAAGQTRAFVVWSRVLTPSGVSIDVGSAGTDRLGRGGLEGETDTHFFQRFGAAILLSVMSAGLQAASHNSTGDTAVIIGSPQQASNIADIALQKQIDIPPTIKVMQGAPLQVFVARDLDFSGLAPAKP